MAVYIYLGLLTEVRFIEGKPLPEWLLEDFDYYSRALFSALQGGDPYEIRDIGRAYIYPPLAFFVVEPIARELAEVLDGLWSVLVEELKRDGPRIRVEGRLRHRA